MTASWGRAIAVGALLLGVALLAIVLRRLDVEAIAQLSRLFGAGLPLALLPGAAWHLVRTEAWRRCFRAGERAPFSTLFRVRLSAEAISYLTISGVTGDPLKVVLLAPAVPPAIAAAATALERAAFLVVTAAIVAVAAAVTAATLPLSPGWTRVYAWSAAVAAAIAVAPPVIVWRLSRRAGRSSPPSAKRPGRARQFLRRFAEEFRILIATDRRRLASVAGLEAAAFLMMALEVFATLVLIGIPVTPPGAVAIETFTRIASFVSGFIPGNLGAMEMSNVAAVGAVYAAGGGVALALLRRVRGLAWCAAGFLVYPGGWRRTRRGAHRDGGAGDGSRTLFAVQDGDSDARVTESLGGMPAGERVARAAVRAGCLRLLVWTPLHREREWQSATKRMDARLEIVATGDASRWRRLCADLDPDTPVTVLAAGIVAPPQLLSNARAQDAIGAGRWLEVPAGPGCPTSGVFRMRARDVAAAGTPALDLPGPGADRPPIEEIVSGSAALTLDISTREGLARAERMLRASIVKPTDGRLARFNRRLSMPISLALIRSSRLSAHAMSLFVVALSLYAGWLFSRGSYLTGVAAALISWAASVLDGCDGELARLQFKESAFGCWVDTLGDYVYYLAVFAGLTVGAIRQTGSPVFWWLGVALGIGLLITLSLLILLRWRITDGRPDRLRSRTKEHFYGTGRRWTRFVAKLSTCATRAMMPYGIVAFALVHLLPVVVVLATIGAHVYWISLAREYRRLVNGPSAEVRLAQSPA